MAAADRWGAASLTRTATGSMNKCRTRRLVANTRRLTPWPILYLLYPLNRIDPGAAAIGSSLSIMGIVANHPRPQLKIP